jgi:hypothetical protein
MEITNKQVYKKLEEIHKDIKLLQRAESEVLQDELKIMASEGELMTTLSKQVPLQFTSIVDWKRYIWDNCEFRKPLEKSKEIDFICGRTANKCRYADCFRNKVK